MDFISLASLTETVARESFLRRLSSSSAETPVPKPLLSPSADAELYALATNFLLYVAMVIIIIIVCKIYFPDLLEPRPPDLNRESHTSGKKTQIDSQGLELEENENDEDETKQLIEDETVIYSDVFSFDQANTDRHTVLKRLIFCSTMLMVTFVTWGVLQERMLTRRYPRFTGEYFTYSYALVFSNRFWTLIMSGMLLLYLKPHRSRSTVIYEYSFPSISNMLSSWCQYEALRYVSFPATTLFKCFKIAPIMFMGRIILDRHYPNYDYAVAVTIGTGISIFMESTDDLQLGYNIYGTNVQTWTGILLLGLYLFF